MAEIIATYETRVYNDEVCIFARTPQGRANAYAWLNVGRDVHPLAKRQCAFMWVRLQGRKRTAFKCGIGMLLLLKVHIKNTHR